MNEPLSDDLKEIERALQQLGDELTPPASLRDDSLAKVKVGVVRQAGAQIWAFALVLSLLLLLALNVVWSLPRSTELRTVSTEVNVKEEVAQLHELLPELSQRDLILRVRLHRAAQRLNLQPNVRRPRLQ